MSSPFNCEPDWDDEAATLAEFRSWAERSQTLPAIPSTSATDPESRLISPKLLGATVNTPELDIPFAKAKIPRLASGRGYELTTIIENPWVCPMGVELPATDFCKLIHDYYPACKLCPDRRPRELCEHMAGNQNLSIEYLERPNVLAPMRCDAPRCKRLGRRSMCGRHLRETKDRGDRILRLRAASKKKYDDYIALVEKSQNARKELANLLSPDALSYFSDLMDLHLDSVKVSPHYQPEGLWYMDDHTNFR